MLSCNFLILMKYKSENMITYICKWSLNTRKQTMTLSGLRLVYCTAYENNSSTTKLLQWRSDIYSLLCKRVQFTQLNYVCIVNLNFKALHYMVERWILNINPVEAKTKAFLWWFALLLEEDRDILDKVQWISVNSFRNIENYFKEFCEAVIIPTPVSYAFKSLQWQDK